jgi:hypothetical protein
VSTARTILTFAAAAVILPLVMRGERDGAGGVRNARLAVAAMQTPQPSAASVRAFLEGVRGANALQCEMILQSFDGWSSNHAPDRDSVAWSVTMVVRQRIATAQSVTDMVAALRGGDDCAARAAARLLGRSRMAAARSELFAALRDDNAQVRRLGAIGLGYSDDSTASAPLVRALTDRDARVRAAAAWALGAVQ